MCRTKDAHRQIVRLLLKNGNQCHLCGEAFSSRKPPTRDHVIPKTLGGKNNIRNIMLAHGHCNQERGKEPVQFFKMRSLFLNLFPFLIPEQKVQINYLRSGISFRKVKFPLRRDANKN